MWLLQSPVNPKPCGTFSWPPARVLSPLFFPGKSLLLPKPHGPSYSLQKHVVPFIPFTTAWPSPSMAAAPGLKSQRPSSFAAPFQTPPTISYTCQHPRILPALLGCHSKSRQLWPHGMEPIISELSRRPCNQGELLPSYILGGSHSHLCGSKHGHSYLTYL